MSRRPSLSAEGELLPHLLEWRHYKVVEASVEEALHQLATRSGPKQSEDEAAAEPAQGCKTSALPSQQRRGLVLPDRRPKKGLYYPICKRSWNQPRQRRQWVPDKPWHLTDSNKDAVQLDERVLGPRLESSRGAKARLDAEEAEALQNLAEYKHMLQLLVDSSLLSGPEVQALVKQKIEECDELYIATAATAELPEGSRPYRCLNKAKYRSKPPVPQQRRKEPRAAIPAFAMDPAAPKLRNTSDMARRSDELQFLDKDPVSLTADAVNKVLAAGGYMGRYGDVSASETASKYTDSDGAELVQKVEELRKRKTTAERALALQQSQHQLEKEVSNTINLQRHLALMIADASSGPSAWEHRRIFENEASQTAAPASDDLVEQKVLEAMKNKPKRRARREIVAPRMPAAEFLGSQAAQTYAFKCKAVLQATR